MRTTIDLPDAIFEQTKITAARRRTTLRNLVVQGLESVLREESQVTPPTDALNRLRQGYHLGNQPIKRGEIHAR